MNKRQKKKMRKKMGKRVRKLLGLEAKISVLWPCNAANEFMNPMADYTGEMRLAESLTRQRATGRRKKRIMASGRRR